MSKCSKSLCLAFLFAVALLIGCGVEEGEEQYELRFAHVVRSSVSKGQAAERFAELVEERSEGRIVTSVYPDSQLGTDREILEQMQVGTVQMNAPFTGVLPSFVPQFQIFDLPYLFTDKEMAFEAMHGPVGEQLDEHLREAGFRSLGYWDGGFKHFTNSERPIETPEDMAGLSFRASQSPLLIAQFRALDAGGDSIPFAELYSALQSGTVDGQENTLDNIYSRGFYEVQDYLTLSEHGYLGFVVLISDDFYTSLPEDLQEIIDEVAQEVAEWQWELAAEDEIRFLEEIKEADIEVIELSDEQKEAFKEATAGVYDRFRERVSGGSELLELLEEVRED